MTSLCTFLYEILLPFVANSNLRLYSHTHTHTLDEFYNLFQFCLYFFLYHSTLFMLIPPFAFFLCYAVC